MALDQLIFDVTDATTRAETHQVGAVVQGVRSGSKELINSQDLNSQEWLNTATILLDDTGSVYNAANPVPVSITDGVNVEVDLSHLDDSVRLGDGTNFLTSTTIGSDIGLDVNVINDPALANTAIASAANTLAVAATAESAVASILADRKYLYLYNNDNKFMHIGGSGVTAADGFPIGPRSTIELRAGANIDVQYVATDAGHELRSLELS